MGNHSYRIAAMECVMSLARILDDSEFADIVVRKNVAQVFQFFLPGLASGFKQIALEDEKVGHKIPQVKIIIIIPNIRISHFLYSLDLYFQNLGTLQEKFLCLLE